MSDQKPKIKYDPVNNYYIDDSKLQTLSDEDELQELYDVGMRPADFPEPSKSELQSYMTKKGLL